MRKDEFVFTIGYQGNVAVIDGKAKSRYGKLSTRELTEAGFYKAAFSSAVFSGDEREMNEFLGLFNAAVPAVKYKKEDLQRLFGVYGVPEGINKIKIIN